MKDYKQYEYVHDTGLRILNGVSILMRKNVPQIKSTSTLPCKQLQSQQPYIKLFHLFTIYPTS